MGRLSIFVLIFFAVVIPFSAGAEDPIKTGETLDLRRCVEIALQRQPNILAAMNTIQVNESRVGQARANYYPQITWTTGYSRNNPPIANPVSRAFQSVPYSDYSSYLNLTQNIYDFGKTADQVKIQNLNRDSSKQDRDNVASQIVFTVKQTYFGLLQAERNQEVARETVKQFQQHLDQAKAFFQVGVSPRFDVIKAEVDLSNATLNLLTAENNVKIARVNINNAMGVPDAPEYRIEDNLALQPYEIALNEAIKKAYATRHDLQSLILKKESQQKGIDLAKTGYYPYLTGTANYGFEGQEFPLDKGWTVGAQLNFPLFSGFSTKYQVAEARASLDVLKANDEALRQSIFLDVKQAWLNLQLARQQISTSELAVRQANENADIANGRYAAGVGNPIEVTDALVAQSNAKTSYIAALYNYKVAQANIEKAMGLQ